jgi:DNA primase
MDAVLRLNKLDFIKAQLATYGGEKKEYGERVMIKCPFHSDNTPSGSLSLSTTFAGSFRCYACGAKANWDQLAERLNLQPFKRGQPKEEYATNFITQAAQFFEEKKLYREDKFQFSDLPANKRWRSISTNLLIELGGQLCVKWSDDYQRWGKTRFIHFPVNINGEQVGFFRARLKKEADQPSYLNAAGKWSLSHGLWPFDYSMELARSTGHRTVVLVEGQRDCMRLLSNGIPTLCIFGTQSFGAAKAKLLELAGMSRLVLLMDGDGAGIDASARILNICQQMFEVKTLKLWNMKGSPYRKFEDHDNPTKAAKDAGVELWDPMNCPQWVIDRIKSKFF